MNNELRMVNNEKVASIVNGGQKISSFSDLNAWKGGHKLALMVYNITRSFPKEELFGLTSQMRRSAVSIPSNIAEGRRRGRRKDFRNFLQTAFGSGAELETQVEIAKRLQYAHKDQYASVEELLGEIMRMLNRMISSLQATS